MNLIKKKSIVYIDETNSEKKKRAQRLKLFSCEQTRLVNTPSWPWEGLKGPSPLLMNCWKLMAAGRGETELFIFYFF